MELMLMLALYKAIDQLITANNVQWYGHVLSRNHGPVLRRALQLDAKCQEKKEKF